MTSRIDFGPGGQTSFARGKFEQQRFGVGGGKPDGCVPTRESLCRPRRHILPRHPTQSVLLVPGQALVNGPVPQRKREPHEVRPLCRLLGEQDPALGLHPPER